MTAASRLAIVLLACLPSVCLADSAEQILSQVGMRGGFVVHVGCDDGKLTAALGAGENYLVQGLDVDAADVAAARRHIQSLGIYGRVAVDTFPGDRLPYADNLANLIVSDDLGDLPMSEVLRVLCPNGTAYIKSGGQWQKTVKPRPEEIDEWTHFLHGPENNAVSRDTVVDVPRRLHWLGAPKFARAHEQLASMGACVTTAGRLFYIIDESPRVDIRFPSEWFLVARDAFNGVVLWKRPLASWADQLRRFRAGPAGTTFRLAAVDDRVYVTLGVDAPVSILDAASGETLAECEGTQSARQVLRVGDKLIVMVDDAPQYTKEDDSMIRRGQKPAPGNRAIVAADPSTGRTLWRIDTTDFVHPTVAADARHVFYQTHTEIHCVDLADGKPLWSQAAEMRLVGHEAGWESPTLVVCDATLYCADFKKLLAINVGDGSVRWTGPSQQGYNSPPDVFVIGDLVWIKGKTMIGLDVASGQVRKEIPTTGGYMHDRCYRNKATERFFLLGEQGVQFVDRESGDVSAHHWIRGTCQYGIMPANGLLYVTPDSCACNMKSKLAGFWALESDGDDAGQADDPVPQRLEKGPAFGDATASPVAADLADWPTHRHDAARSGTTEAGVPASLQPAWRATLGGRLSAPTIAAGQVFVASIDTHTVHALDQQSGKSLWSFTAGGRIDSPPTIYDGKAFFGSADGWVYAVRAADGQLAWRFRAAPRQRSTFVNGQLESAWPVHGSLLVHQGELVVAAGRSSYLDGGIRLYRLDPRTGETLRETVVYSPDSETGKQPKITGGDPKDVRGLLSDILLADGDDVYMRQAKLNFDTGLETDSGMHLFCPVGLLDDSWWHRGYWVMSDRFIAHWSGWWKIGNVVPSGRILSYDERSVFGYGRDKYPSGNTGQWRGGEHYQLFACDRPGEPQPPASVEQRRKAGPATFTNRWTAQIPFHARALLVAGEVMFIAGPPELTQTQGVGEEALILQRPADAVAAWRGMRGGQLWAVSTSDGATLAEYRLDAPPVFDGMAATDGRLYLATMDGNVICYAK